MQLTSRASRADAAFMRDTLKPGSRATLTTEYALVPDFVVKAIDDHEQSR